MHWALETFRGVGLKDEEPMKGKNEHKESKKKMKKAVLYSYRKK